MTVTVTDTDGNACFISIYSSSTDSTTFVCMGVQM